MASFSEQFGLVEVATVFKCVCQVVAELYEVREAQSRQPDETEGVMLVQLSEEKSYEELGNSVEHSPDFWLG